MNSKLDFDLERMEGIIKVITFLYGTEALILQNSRFDPKFDADFRQALGELNRRFIALQRDILQKDKKSANQGNSIITNCGKTCDVLLVAEDDLVRYIEMGWEVVKELSNGKIVVRKPTVFEAH